MFWDFEHLILFSISDLEFRVLISLGLLRGARNDMKWQVQNDIALYGKIKLLRSLVIPP